MKKLLATLGALSIVSSTTSVVSCEYANLVKSSIENKIRNYIATSSLLARATVLSQKADHQAEGGEGLSLKASSQFLYNRNIREYFTRSELPTDSDSNTVRQMLGTMFSFGSGNSDVYTVKNVPSFETNLALEDSVDTGRQSQDSFANTFGIITGLASLLLGNNFSDTQASFLANALNAITGLVGNAVTANDGQLIGQILDFVRLRDADESIPAGDYIFKTFQDSLKEDDLPNIENLTFNDVFKIRYVDFWTGLAQILYSGTAKPNNENWTDFITNIKNQNSTPGANNAENVANAALFSKNFDVKFNARLLNGIADVLRFLRTIFVFFHHVNENSILVSDLDPNSDYNHTFQKNMTNGRFIDEMLNDNYMNQEQVAINNKPSICQWVEINGTYYQVLNLQSLFGFVQNFLSFDPNDPHGYAFQRILSVIFTIPLKNDNTQDTTVMTLFFDGVIDPLAKKLVDLFVDDFLTKAAILAFLPRVFLILRNTLGSSTAAWEAGEGTTESLQGFLTFLSTNPLVPANIKAIASEILKSINDEQDDVNKNSLPLFEQNWGNPIWGIYGNELLGEILPIILDLIIQSDNKEEEINKITELFENLTKILTTKLSVILETFGLDISTLPIYLYGLWDLTITDIINTIANEFEVKRNGKIEDQQRFLLNNYSLADLFGSLDNNVQISFNSGSAGETMANKFGLIDSSGNINTVFATLLAFGYDADIVNIMTGSDQWIDQHGLVKSGFILGIRQQPGNNGPTYSFAKNSVLWTLAALYGNDVSDIFPASDVALMNRPTMQRIIKSLNDLSTWFNTVSIPLYVNTFFTPFFRRENWRTQLLKSSNIEDLRKEAEIIYKMRYYQPNTKRVLDYEVTLKRDPASGNGGDWDEFAAWYIKSIRI